MLNPVSTGLVAANPGLGKLLFALLFPVGLTMNTLHGTELFTGNTMKLPAAIYEGKTNLAGLAKNWFWSYLGETSWKHAGCIDWYVIVGILLTY